MSLPVTNVASPPGKVAALRRFATKRTAAEHCEICGSELNCDHPHLFDIQKRLLVCACEACMKTPPSAEASVLRRVPKEVRSLPGFRITDAQWQSLMIPIDMAFFFKSSPQARVVAFYPSPAGAIESLLTLETWAEVVNDNSAISKMIPDVEALLVNRVGIARGVTPEYYIAPIDQCYRLVGLIRAHWRGLSGGTEVWREIGSFFSALKDKSAASKEVEHA